MLIFFLFEVGVHTPHSKHSALQTIKKNGHARGHERDVMGENRIAQRAGFEGNSFQVGITTLRGRISDTLEGLEVTMDKDDGFTVPHDPRVEWGGPQRVRGRIEDVLYDGHFVCSARFGDEPFATPLTAASLLLNSTELHLDERVGQFSRVYDHPVPEGRKHELSVGRARQIAEEALSRLTPQELAEAHTRCVLTFDGNGENRAGFEDAFAAAGLCEERRPLVITVEKEPVPALNQLLCLGPQRVRFSQGDFRRRRRRDVCEGIERLVAEDSESLLTEAEKRSTTLLYLDYCGGPNPNFDYERVYERLPNLKVVAITAAWRQPNKKHPCRKRIQAAAPAGWKLIREFKCPGVLTLAYARPSRKRARDAQEDAREDAPPRTSKKAAAKAATAAKTKAKAAAKAAAACVGTEVRVPLSAWPDGPGPQYDAVLRADGALRFVVAKTHRRVACAVRAMLEGGQVGPIESFVFAPSTVRAYAACAC